MQNPNKYACLFLFSMAFAVSGVGMSLARGLARAAVDMVADMKSGNAGFFENFRAKVDEVTSKRLSYHGILMDINSIKDNLLGTRIVIKDGSVIVKSDSGSLMNVQEKIAPGEIQRIAEQIARLQHFAESKGARFLYGQAPLKAFFETPPANAEDHCAENHGALLEELGKRGVPFLDFAETIAGNRFDLKDAYYYTDHHWTARVGFYAAQAICSELHARYGFEYDGRIADIGNYGIALHRNWFLGSAGKKVGSYFTWHGLDDFELITPRFETALVEKQPVKNLVRSGKFEDTVLHMEHMKKKRYEVNPYSTYSGGDFRLQIVENTLNPSGKKMLLIRDSSACVVAPFLALHLGELHVCDIRNYVYFIGDRVNLAEHIGQFEPDYVVVLYSGASGAMADAGRYSFFPERTR